MEPTIINVDDKVLTFLFNKERNTLLIKIEIYQEILEIELDQTNVSKLFPLLQEIIESNNEFVNFILTPYFKHKTYLKSGLSYNYWKYSYDLQGEKPDEKSDEKLAEVYISLPQEELDLFQIENIQNACGEFMETLGFELKIQEEPVYGSFFQRILFALKSEETKNELNDVYSKGKQALEAQFLNLPTAEATDKLASAASNIITSLSPIDEAAIRLGILLVVKVKREGKATIMVETISPSISSILDNNPFILNSPNAVFELINAEKKNQSVVGEGEGAEVSN